MNAKTRNKIRKLWKSPDEGVWRQAIELVESLGDTSALGVLAADLDVRFTMDESAVAGDRLLALLAAGPEEPSLEELRTRCARMRFGATSITPVHGAAWLRVLHAQQTDDFDWNALRSLRGMCQLTLTHVDLQAPGATDAPWPPLDRLELNGTLPIHLPRLSAQRLRVDTQGTVHFGAHLAAEEIHVRGEVVDVRGLAASPALRSFLCDRTSVVSLEGFEASKHTLEQLHFGTAPQLNSLHALRDATALKHLYVGASTLDTLDDVGTMQALATLSLTGAAVSDLAPLQGLKHLRVLDLRRCGSVRSLDPIADLELDLVVLAGTAVVPDAVPPSLRHRVSWADEPQLMLFGAPAVGHIRREHRWSAFPT